MASPQPSVWYHSVSFSRVWNFQLALFGLLPRYLFVSLRFSDLRPYFRIIVSFFSFRYWFLFLPFFISKYFYLLSSFLIFVFGVDMKKWKCQCSIQHYKSKTTSKRISQTKQQTRIHRSLSLYLAPNSLASTHTFYWKRLRWRNELKWSNFRLTGSLQLIEYLLDIVIASPIKLALNVSGNKSL